MDADDLSLRKSKGCLGGLGCLVALLIGTGWFAPHCDRERYRAEVTDKERVYNDGGSRYLIYTRLPNGETRVFKNTDSLLEWKFDSSDMYAEIEPGKTYDFDTYGWRVPLFSEYENIIGKTEVPEEE